MKTDFKLRSGKLLLFNVGCLAWLSWAPVCPCSAEAAAVPIPKFRAVNIDTNIAIGYGVATADVDGDKKVDILLADKNQVVWYQSPDWSKHVMAEKLTELDHVCLAAADLNGDGKAEVAVGAGWNPGDTVNSGASFFLLPPSGGGDRTKLWTPIKLPHEPTMHRMKWIRNPSGTYDLLSVPLHGRGNKNGQGDGVRILAYKVPAEIEGGWRSELVDSSLHMTHNFHLVRWEGNAWDELLVAAKEGVFHMVKGAGGWRRQQLVGNEAGQTNFFGAGEVRDGWLAGKRRFVTTIEPMHGNQLVLYTAPPAGNNQRFWSRRVLDESLVDGHALAAGDVLGLGYDQIVVGWRAMNRPGVKVGIKIWIPLDGEGREWQPVVIDDQGMACEDLVLVDLNQDGKLDIVAAGRATRNVKVYWNER